MIGDLDDVVRSLNKMADSTSQWSGNHSGHGDYLRGIASIIESQAFKPYRAHKIGGSYQAKGTVVAEFKTTTGLDRIVFEFDEPKGLLHIFSKQQVFPE